MPRLGKPIRPTADTEPRVSSVQRHDGQNDCAVIGLGLLDTVAREVNTSGSNIAARQRGWLFGHLIPRGWNDRPSIQPKIIEIIKRKIQINTSI